MLGLKVPQEVLDSIDALAKTTKRSRSEVALELLQMGLSSSGGLSRADDPPAPLAAIPPGIKLTAEAQIDLEKKLTRLTKRIEQVEAKLEVPPAGEVSEVTSPQELDALNRQQLGVIAKQMNVYSYKLGRQELKEAIVCAQQRSDANSGS